MKYLWPHTTDDGATMINLSHCEALLFQQHPAEALARDPYSQVICARAQVAHVECNLLGPSKYLSLAA
jgi:hypothetical protein